MARLTCAALSMVPPPARGWSPWASRSPRSGAGSPACAGMVPRRPAPHSHRPRFPRLRGDGPPRFEGAVAGTPVPPPARGWSRWRANATATGCGSPACAGMVPYGVGRIDYAAGFPRLRGDGPVGRLTKTEGGPVPPPARGWSPIGMLLASACVGSPACAGMVPRPARREISTNRFPRLRGDGPLSNRMSWFPTVVPPPARGWSPPKCLGYPPVWGSPACAGMVRGYTGACATERRFPRLRGDGPHRATHRPVPRRVPPPARGWSHVHVHAAVADIGSPACAGMVPTRRLRHCRCTGFPRLRGDGPPACRFSWPPDRVPPPARGWSPGMLTDAKLRQGSPACAGMVPCPPFAP